jgi:hypothetical protein
MRASAARLVTAAALLVGAQALPKITRTGRYLYDDSGNRYARRSSVLNVRADRAPRVVFPSRVSATSSKVRRSRGRWWASAPRLTRGAAGGSTTSFIDPLSSGANCTRDLPYLKHLGVNAVRVYSVNASTNHDDCMKALRCCSSATLQSIVLTCFGSGANIYAMYGTSFRRR